MNELHKMLNSLIDQAEDVFDHFNATPIFEVKTIENPRDGTFSAHIEFTYKTKYFNGKPKLFSYNSSAQTVDNFINEIRSYLFDCIDAFVNLL